MYTSVSAKHKHFPSVSSLPPADLQGTAQHAHSAGRHGDVVVAKYGVRGRRPLGDPARLHEVPEGERSGAQRRRAAANTTAANTTVVSRV